MVRGPHDHSDSALVSVVLAAYQGAPFIAEQLESLNRQTRLPDELVIADDCSSDRTVAIAEQFSRRARFPVKILRRDRHGGTCENFTDGLLAAEGDILLICDQDDRWHPDKVAVMAERMEQHPRALLAFSDAVLVNTSGHQISRSRWRIAAFGPPQWEAMDHDPFGQMLMRQVMSGCTAGIRRELLTALLPFPEGLHPALPTMMYDRWISLVAAAAGSVLIVPERLVDYRIHPGQQIGVPALPLRRLAPHMTLRLGQFVAPAIEKEGRFGYMRVHVEEIRKRLIAGGLDSATSELWLRLADQHLALRSEITSNRSGRLVPAAKEYLRADGYRRFSLGFAAMASDLIR